MTRAVSRLDSAQSRSISGVRPEGELISERTVAGLRGAKARGRALGRPPALSDKQIKMARSMKVAGDYSSRVILAQLGVSRATLYRALAQTERAPSLLHIIHQGLLERGHSPQQA